MSKGTDFTRYYEPLTARKALFGRYADATLARVRALYATRGAEYGDTWASCQWLTLQAVARQTGCRIPLLASRAIAAAVFVDMKHSRMLGGYKDDNLLDGIAYQALLAEEMRQFLAPPKRVTETESPSPAGEPGESVKRSRKSAVCGRPGQREKSADGCGRRWAGQEPKRQKRQKRKETRSR